MVETFEAYLDAKPGDWVVFNPEYGVRTSFWDREMVICIKAVRDGQYIFEVQQLKALYPQTKDATGTCSNAARGFRKAMDHEIPANIINNYSIY